MLLLSLDNGARATSYTTWAEEAFALCVDVLGVAIRSCEISDVGASFPSLILMTVNVCMRVAFYCKKVVSWTNDAVHYKKSTSGQWEELRCV